jgi:hypothetical protein
MPAEDVLLMMAQLGVAIAGFNGIANAVHAGETRTAWHSFASSILVTAAAAVVLWSVVPLVLLTTSLSASRVWQVSSLGWGLYQFAIMIFRYRQGITSGLTPPPLYWAMLPMLMAAVALQVWNGVLGGLAWPHLVGVATSLLVAMVAFFLLVHEGESGNS